MILHLEKSLADDWAGDDPFVRAEQQTGEFFRTVKGRCTLRFSAGGKSYFLKLHTGIGWGEILKNLSHLRLPVLGAKNEWRAIQRLTQLGIHTMTIAGYGQRGFNPAKQFSFLVTHELADMCSLEDLCVNWKHRPVKFSLKHALITEAANIARKLHENNINHRDFYLCHLLIDVSTGLENMTAENFRVYVIDLHRAQIRKKTPIRWIIKDLAGLYFSALDIGLTSRDVFRFMKVYRRKNVRQLMTERVFWSKVSHRTQRFYQREFGHDAVMPIE